MLRDVRDPYLPPDHDAFVGSGETRRIIIIAPTRAACETIELAFALDIETVLWKARGAELRELAERFRAHDLEAPLSAPRRGFGIVAGTIGTGTPLDPGAVAAATAVLVDGMRAGDTAI